MEKILKLERYSRSSESVERNAMSVGVHRLDVVEIPSLPSFPNLE